jgi:hypothetical protein
VSHRNARDDRIPTELPLPDYLEWARKRNDELYSAGTDGGHFRSHMWEFVRFCAAHPQLRGLAAMDAFQQISSVNLKDGRPLSWADAFDSDDPEAEFLATWGKVRVPAGDDILTLAVALAKERPLCPKNCISQRFALYVSIAGRIQELRPGDYINLPVERLGKALSVDERTISYYAQLAKKDGYISLIAKHHKLSGTAAKYEFHSERFNMETGEELDPEDNSHFHKDCKDSQDCKESKDDHEKETTSRTSEEPERRTGAGGFGFDLKRELGKLSRGARTRKMEGSSLPERRKLLEQQSQLLEARKKRRDP